MGLETIKEEIDDIRSGALITKNIGIQEWADLIKAFDLKVSNELARVLPDPIDPCEDTFTENYVGPFMSTTWGQGCGYNDYSPITSNYSFCNLAPTGCVATAMAQILNYWHNGTNYNWANMASNYGTPSTSLLMKDAGVAVGMMYGTNSSGAYMTDVPNAFLNGFSYSSATYISYGIGSSNTIRNQLDLSMPVILSGASGSDAHAWVSDGYYSSTTTYCEPHDGIYGYGALYFYMNWGWDGTSNGYYAYAGNWGPYNTSYTFTSQRQAIINIHP